MITRISYSGAASLDRVGLHGLECNRAAFSHTIDDLCNVFKGNSILHIILKHDISVYYVQYRKIFHIKIFDGSSS